MSKRAVVPESRRAALTAEQLKRGITRLEKLINEIQNFNIQSIKKRRGPEVQELEASIEGALASVFGHNTVEYNRYKYAAALDQGPVTVHVSASWIDSRHGSHGYHDESREVQQYLSEGKERSTGLLRSAISWLQDELETFPAQNTEPQSLTEHGGMHPEIKEKCEVLYTSGSFAEAVEKSFKIVRDRLRDLTGHEKGSEAFGKGKLHIRGAIAPHVDSDFNEGAKFLMMAIDMFRNEKAHTSNAKITNPARAEQYLMLSSLAMYLLDEAEIRS